MPVRVHRQQIDLPSVGCMMFGLTTKSGSGSLKYTRAILDAIHSGELAKAEYEVYDTFQLHVPTAATGVPAELLNPKRSWAAGAEDFQHEVTKLAKLFNENFKKYADEATPEVINAGGFFQYNGRDLFLRLLLISGQGPPYECCGTYHSLISITLFEHYI